MKILLLDIETSPNVVHVWDLFKPMVGLDQIVEPTRMLCWSAKWLGATKAPEFRSVYHHDRATMVERMHELLDEADAVVHYNGKSFDMPIINAEFLQAGLKPPSPYHQIDLYLAVKKTFRFPSHKLAFILKVLDKAPKEDTGGHLLWVGCLAGDPKAWATMRRYSRRDVTALEDLYNELLPWIPNHPSRNLVAAAGGLLACPKCGSEDIQRRGYATTQMSRYQRYHCQSCGGWSRATRREDGTNIRECA